MIRTNLSTRPFYNERVVNLWLAGLLVVIVLASVFNVTRAIQYSRSDTELGTQAARDESRASELRTRAVRLRGTVDAKQVEVASSEARRANDLIDRRTFSWTDLWNRFEATLPDEVRITAFRPKVDRGQISLSISVVARSVDEIGRFIDSLTATRAFVEVVSGDERVTEDGLIEATLQTIYLPSAGAGGAGDAGAARADAEEKER